MNMNAWLQEGEQTEKRIKLKSKPQIYRVDEKHTMTKNRYLTEVLHDKKILTLKKLDIIYLQKKMLIQ